LQNTLHGDPYLQSIEHSGKIRGLTKFFSPRFSDPEQGICRRALAFYLAEFYAEAGDAIFQHPVLAGQDVRLVTIKKAYVE